ncbi:MAG: Nif3-like dinuclear metal center hexameric protein [Eubacteriaceae bacterium]|nr:Nif3-like dinuclear metal center hexameric protein [Eubacteriaceae bacterium]
MKKRDLVKVIQSFCPDYLAEEWDNCGFQIDNDREDVDRILVALEITDDVISEALENKADMIITHHPMLFLPIRNIDVKTIPGSYISKLIKGGISVYSCHTSFDKAENGNNDYIGRILDLENVRPFDKDNGFCRKGETPFETTFAEFVYQVADAFQIDEKHFRYVGDKKRIINSIGWCSGSGAEFIDDAVREGCDLYITGDLKYHDAVAAKEKGICVLDAGHYGTEKIFVENMAELLQCRLRDEKVEIIQSIIDINPFL